ncbi:Mut7-C RNAse domain-containing protein [candidate division WOR-3 bacterium]|nr:Mut7-C RNAse domain-containing protein [candidate division WOR-3 bacterium]
MPAFLCNGMLGTLCKLMRMCGFDTAFSNEGTAILVQARRENRVIITRNTRFQNNADVHYLAASDPLEQLNTVITTHGLKTNIKILSRCLECNAPLEPIERSAVQDRVPYFTYQNFNEFSECPVCHKIYWKGSHYTRMINSINAALRRIDPAKD